jgi:hypothetical protein
LEIGGQTLCGWLDADGSWFTVAGNCNTFYMNIIMYFALDPWMTTVDLGDGSSAVDGRPFRPSPS